MPDSIEIRTPQSGDEIAILQLWRDAITSGELNGFELSDAEILSERLIPDATKVFVAADDSGVLGFLHDLVHLLVVRRDARRRGIATRLVAAAENAPEHASGQPLLLWLPGGNPGAAAFYEAIGFRRHSSLWQLERGAETPVAPPRFPDSLIERTAAEVDIDAYVALFNAAFADHPTPLSVTREIVEWAQSRPDYDPTAILVLEERASSELIGFARINTNREPGEAGEVRFIGLLPSWRGRGLGAQLLAWGINRVRASGRDRVQLTVEGENELALSLYVRTGFTRTFEWPRYARIAATT